MKKEKQVEEKIKLTVERERLTEESSQKTKIEKERRKMEGERRKIETEKWSTGNLIKKIENELKLVDLDYQEILEKENKVRRKIEEITGKGVVKEKEKEKENICPHCGIKVKPGLRFCPQCGKKL